MSKSLIDLSLRYINSLPGENVAIRYYADENTEMCLDFNALRKSLKELTEAIRCLTQGKRQLVGVSSSTTLMTPVIILSCLNSNCGFVCLNIHSDQTRRTVDKLGIKFIVTTNTEIQNYSKEKELTVQMETITFWTTGVTTIREIESDLVYAIQTSGSTGEPKIIRVTNASIVPNVKDLSQKFELDFPDRIILSSPLTFDPSIIEIFLSFITGCQLVVPNSTVRQSPDALSRVILKSEVTFYQTTPSIFRRTKAILGVDSSLKTLVLGGELFLSREELLRLNVPDRIKVFNIYGITELSCWATLKQWTHLDTDTADIGLPLDETLLKFEEHENLHHLFVGSSSRICLVNNESYNQVVSSGAVYRATGDLFRISNGKYYFERRRDKIIKKFGNRVDTGALERSAAELGLMTRVNACMVAAEPRISMFIDLSQSCEELEGVLSELRKISAYWPDDIVTLPEFPLTHHGKIDDRQLMLMACKGVSPSESFASAFKKSWHHFSGSTDDNLSFFQSGGDSFKALQLIQDLETRGFLVHSALAGEIFRGGSLASCTALLNLSQTQIQKNKSIVDLNFESDSKWNNITCLRLKGRIFGTDPKLEIRPILKRSWEFDLEKCVDASPLGVSFKSGRHLVIIGSHSGLVQVFEATGQVVSKTRLPGRIESSAALASDGSRYFIVSGCYDGKVYAIDVDSGKILWAFSTQDMVKATCSVYNGVYFGSYDKHIYKISEDGGLIWKRLLNGSILAETLVVDSVAIVGTLTGSVFCLSQSTGDELWEANVKSIFSNMNQIWWPKGKHILVADVSGTLHWFDLKGNEVSTHSIGQSLFSTPVVTDAGRVLVVTTESMTLFDGADTLWQVRVSRVVSTPFPSGSNAIVATTNGEIHLVNLDTGQITFGHCLPGETFSSPIIIDERIFIGCRDNRIYCLEMANEVDGVK